MELKDRRAEGIRRGGIYFICHRATCYIFSIFLPSFWLDAEELVEKHPTDRRAFGSSTPATPPLAPTANIDNARLLVLANDGETCCSATPLSNNVVGGELLQNRRITAAFRRKARGGGGATSTAHLRMRTMALPSGSIYRQPSNRSYFLYASHRALKPLGDVA